MKIEDIETVLVCGIIVVQLYFFFRTLSAIVLFRGIVPDTRALHVKFYPMPAERPAVLGPAEVMGELGRLSGQDRPPSPEEEAMPGIVWLTAIDCDTTPNRVFGDILYSLNTYLIRNRNAATDFHLMKDIVERNIDAVQEEINLTIAVPLYLGLMGTMLGIVISLYGMSDLSTLTDTHTMDAAVAGDKLGQVVGILLGGVRIAMLASFAGIILMIINSGVLLKGARRLMEKKKNAFYTFLQVYLLPVVNQGLASTFDQLQKNLARFNGTFETNIERLSGIFDSNYKTLFLQKEILEKLEQSKVSEMTRYNVEVLRELQNAMGHFATFNQYLTSVNSYVAMSYQLTGKVSELLDRTKSVDDVAREVDTRLTESKDLMVFLSQHFSDLQRHRQYVSDTMADTGHSMKGIFDELRGVIQSSSQAVKDFTVDELSALKKALSESRTNLSNLQFLEPLNQGMIDLKAGSATQREELKVKIEQLYEATVKSVGVLEEIEKKTGRERERPGFFRRLFGVFKRRKT